MHKFAIGGTVVLAALLLTGCRNPDAIATVSVSGTVTYKGQPVSGAAVAFYKKSASGRNATGTTDSAGKFTLTTYVKREYQPAGAMEGEYTVTVTKVSSTAGMSAEDMGKMAADMGKQGNVSSQAPPPSTSPTPRNELPEKYASPATSDLSATVSSSSTSFTFDLKD